MFITVILDLVGGVTWYISKSTQLSSTLYTGVFENEVQRSILKKSVGLFSVQNGKAKSAHLLYKSKRRENKTFLEFRRPCQP